MTHERVAVVARHLLLPLRLIQLRGRLTVGPIDERYVGDVVHSYGARPLVVSHARERDPP